MPNIAQLADQAMLAFRDPKSKLTLSSAVWRALRENGMADLPDSADHFRRVFANLRLRSRARRRKIQAHRGRVLEDMFATAAARGGDPKD